jgi:hypothetical protein
MKNLQGDFHKVLKGLSHQDQDQKYLECPAADLSEEISILWAYLVCFWHRTGPSTLNPAVVARLQNTILSYHSTPTTAFSRHTLNETISTLYASAGLRSSNISAELLPAYFDCPSYMTSSYKHLHPFFVLMESAVGPDVSGKSTLERVRILPSHITSSRKKELQTALDDVCKQICSDFSNWGTEYLSAIKRTKALTKRVHKELAKY